MEDPSEPGGGQKRRLLRRRKALAVLLGPAAFVLTGCQASSLAAAATAGPGKGTVTLSPSPMPSPSATATTPPSQWRLFVGGTTKEVVHTGPPPTSEYASCTDLLSTVNRDNSLAPDCHPPDLVALPDDVIYLVEDPELLVRDFVRDAFLAMVYAAANQGYSIYARSAYRSYDRQGELFQYWVDTVGYEEANRTSARAGHSEHQLGTAVDVTSPSNDFQLEGFEDTAEGWWVGENAWRYGFHISYPPGLEAITGYAFEPWHLRFVGQQPASLLRSSGLTLNQYLGLA